MNEDPYLYPGTTILRNKEELQTREQLERAERILVTQRIREGVPTGDFDLKHLQAIHRHLFQDVFTWAGEVRTVEIEKGGHPFIFCQFIESGIADVHRQIRDQNYLAGLKPDQFADAAARIIGDVNYVHPFREGNGRTQLFYLKQLTERAGHAIELDRLHSREWIEASIRAHKSEYVSMAHAIRQALVDREPEKASGTELPGATERLEAVRELLAKSRSKGREDRGR